MPLISRLVMQADGALQQKIDAYIKVNERYAEALEKQKWVPEVVMGSQNNQTGRCCNRYDEFTHA